ncbi:MAG TPA: cyclic nucleotide-binding domain-containing protein [Acidobacteriota bacterium]|nr:cyclic nucleotide-binding domain-containing protein [Acidobacteriota bacterium]HQQ47857.1 cyclic nucleotide-binding domain-containing protein [Acidobacteriota bacterium]
MLDKAQERSTRAREFLENGQYKEAATAFISIGEYASAARALVCIKAYKEAAQCYEKAAKPLDAARLYLLIKEWAKAADLFHAAGDEMRAEVARDQLKREQGEISAPEDIKAVEEAPPAVKKEPVAWPEGDIWKAIAIAEMDLAVSLYLKPGAKSGWILMQESKGQEVTNALGEMLFLARDYAIAADAFRVAKNDLKAAQCYSLAGLFEESADLYVRCGEKSLAAENLEKAHQWSRAADIYSEEGRFLDAARCFEKMNEPVRAAGMFLKAQKADLALPLLQSVPPNSPHFSQCRLLAGKILFQKQQRDLALMLLAPLNEADMSSDASFDILYQLAGLMEFGKEVEKAKEIYMRMQTARFGYKDVGKRLEALMSAPQPAPPQQPSRQQPQKPVADDIQVDTSPLRDCSLLHRLDLNDLRHLWSIGNVLEPAQGDIVLRKGDNSDGLYFVLQGGLSITSDPGNPSLVVGFLGRSDFVGLGSLIQGPPQPNYMIAQKETKILYIPKGTLERMVSTEPELGLRLFRSISEHLVQKLMEMSKPRK